MDIFNDYIPSGSVPAATVEKYGHRIPEELLQVWQERGFGSFFGGYFKVIDPADYEELLQQCYFRGKDAVPILANPFGDLITFEKGRFITLVSIRKGICTIMIHPVQETSVAEMKLVAYIITTMAATSKINCFAVRFTEWTFRCFST